MNIQRKRKQLYCAKGLLNVGFIFALILRWWMKLLFLSILYCLFSYNNNRSLFSNNRSLVSYYITAATPFPSCFLDMLRKYVCNKRAQWHVPIFQVNVLNVLLKPKTDEMSSYFGNFIPRKRNGIKQISVGFTSIQCFVGVLFSQCWKISKSPNIFVIVILCYRVTAYAFYALLEHL